MKASIEREDDRVLLELLHRLGGATVRQLSEAVGVTPSAVRQRLARLQSGGLVERQAVRSGRGRPKHVYRLTGPGRRALGENYAELTAVLWRELLSIEDAAVRQRMVERIRDALVQRYGSLVDGPTLAERLSQLRDALRQRGFQVEVDTEGETPVLRESYCPYPDLASTDPSICQLEQEVFERILGEDVQLTRCCRDGSNCCEFLAGVSEADGPDQAHVA